MARFCSGDSSIACRGWSELFFGTDKHWLAFVGFSGISVAAAVLLHRRRRRLREETTTRLQKGNLRPSTSNGTPGGHSRVRSNPSTSTKPPRRPSMAKSGSLSDTYKWNADGVDIGAVLGVDIGGTLSKLVYFEKKAPSKAQSKRRPSDDPMGKKVRGDMTRGAIRYGRGGWYLADSAVDYCTVRVPWMSPSPKYVRGCLRSSSAGACSSAACIGYCNLLYVCNPSDEAHVEPLLLVRRMNNMI